MTTLNWRTVAEIRFTRSLIPQPRNQGQTTDSLSQVSVAVEGGFLHVDPRRVDDKNNAGVADDVFIVPATFVEYVKYVAEKDEDYDPLKSVY